MTTIKLSEMWGLLKGLIDGGGTGGGGTRSIPPPLNVYARNNIMGSTMAFSAEKITFQNNLGDTISTGWAFTESIDLAVLGVGGRKSETLPSADWTASIYALYNSKTQAQSIIAVDTTDLYSAYSIFENWSSDWDYSALLTVIPAYNEYIPPVLVMGNKVSYVRKQAVTQDGATTDITVADISLAVPMNAKSISGHVTITVVGGEEAMCNVLLYPMGPPSMIGGISITQAIKSMANVEIAYWDLPLGEQQKLYYNTGFSGDGPVGFDIHISSYRI